MWFAWMVLVAGCGTDGASVPVEPPPERVGSAAPASEREEPTVPAPQEQPVEQPVNLFEAVASGDAKRVSRELGAGADPEVTNSDGETPLHRAISMGDPSVISALLDGGAS